MASPSAPLRVAMSSASPIEPLRVSSLRASSADAAPSADARSRIYCALILDLTGNLKGGNA